LAQGVFHDRVGLLGSKGATRFFAHPVVPAYCCRCMLGRRLGECVATGAVAAAVWRAGSARAVDL